MKDLFEDREVKFSECRLYRYSLRIVWDSNLPVCQFIGLNPSTADEFQDDPTIRRCRGFAKLWNFGGIVMTNLFAFRATDPEVMKQQIDPVGIDNDKILLEVAVDSGRTIACWGVHGAHRYRAKKVKELFLEHGLASTLQCFGLTKDGHPPHPLYLPKNSTLQFL